MFFTETTFHTDCESIVDSALCLKVFLIHIWIIGDDYIRVQDASRVKDGFDATIDFVRFFAPFHFNKWRYHAACTVFSFQRTTEARERVRTFLLPNAKVLSIFRIAEVRCNVKVNVTGQGIDRRLRHRLRIVFVE